MQVPADAERALLLAVTALAGRDDIVGIGLGPDTVPGRPAVHVMTSPRRDRTQRAELPTEIGGLATVISVAPAPPRPLLIPNDLPGEPWLPPSQDVDRRHERVLMGGIAVSSSDNRGTGSLGFFLTSAVTGKAYGTSNMHVLAPGNIGHGAAPYRVVEVHHPSVNFFWFQPDTEIGRLVATGDGYGYVEQSSTLDEAGSPLTYDHQLDLAVFELRSGTRWVPAVGELGGIVGVASDLTFERICLGPPYPVATKGALGGEPTGGHIHCMSFWLTNDTGLPLPPSGAMRNDMRKYGHQLVIRSNPQVDGSPGVFAQPGDSGSAILNTNHELVGIVRAGIGYGLPYDPFRIWDIDGHAPDIADTFAHSIDEIMAGLASFAPTSSLDLEVAIAESTDADAITPRVQP